MIRKEEICKQCGARCCKGPSPNITIFDVIRILKHLGEGPEKVSTYFEILTHEEYLCKVLPERFNVHISYETIQELKRRLGKYFENILIIKLKKREDNSCIFLKEDDKCSIYVVRPMACRAYPLKITGPDDSCPMVKYGVDLSYERSMLEIYVREIEEHYRLFMSREITTVRQLVEVLSEYWNKVPIL
ncbi:MAG: YkgJ family cysteine cluster protein [Crenarchaeota archaeon]|nr:YkgJ family cysteine cluster protein [Thermoproteota archaeon]